MACLGLLTGLLFLFVLYFSCLNGTLGNTLFFIVSYAFGHGLGLGLVLVWSEVSMQSENVQPKIM